MWHSADELHKSSAYLTEAVFPACPTVSVLPVGPPASTAAARSNSDPTRAPFNRAFACGGVGYFAWLEGEGCTQAGTGLEGQKEKEKGGAGSGNPNRFRLERFGRAMSGTGNWEAPGAVLQGEASSYFIRSDQLLTCL